MTHHCSQKLDKNCSTVELNSQKHPGLVLNINNYNKIIGIMKKLSLFLLEKILLTIYKSFVRPNLDYADIIYDKLFNKSFKTKIEIIQYCR